MRIKIYIFTALLLTALTGSAAGHPLGNFSINQYSRIEVRNSDIRIRQVFDMAEIPTFQESSLIDTDKDGTLSDNELKTYIDKITPSYLENLQLTVNEKLLTLTVSENRIWTETGAGNLPTLKMTWDLVGKTTSQSNINRVHFENGNYRDRLGWSEIVVNRMAGVSVYNSTAFGSGLTDELKAYPQESLSSPLHERAADFSYTSNAAPGDAALLKNRDGQASTPVQKDRLAELIAVPELTPAIALFGLILAFGFGAMHAMSPGHGKTVVGAYLVGSRGTPKHAIFLGLTVTITHTLGVFALGLITLFASNFILPERLIPFLTFVSGLLVFFIGATLFKDRLFTAIGWKKDEHHHHPGDEHPHEHNGLTHTHGGVTHTHLPPEDVSLKSLLALGISGGLLPCPSALVLMLSAISLGRVGYGLILTLVFSFGLAATLTAVGLIFLYVGKVFGNSSLAENRLFKALPVLSAFVIASVGAVICYSSLG